MRLIWMVAGLTALSGCHLVLSYSQAPGGEADLVVDATDIPDASPPDAAMDTAVDTAVPDQMEPDAAPPGQSLWARSFGDSDTDAVIDVAVDNAGNTTLCGTFTSSLLTIGSETHTNQGGLDIILISYDPAGNVRWSKAFGAFGKDHAEAIAADGAGNVYIAGGNADGVDFGGGTLPSGALDDVFLAAFDTDGVYLWSRTFPAPQEQATNGIAVTSTGSLVITGYFQTELPLDMAGCPKLVATSPNHAFLASFEAASGDCKWAKRFGESNDTRGSAVATDANGGVSVAGIYNGSLILGGSLAGKKGNTDIYLARFAYNGVYGWAKTYGSTGSYQVEPSLAMDDAGTIVLSGKLRGQPNFGGGPLTGSNDDLYLASFGSNGAHSWSKTLGASVTVESVGDIAVTAAGQLYLVGHANGPADLGGGPLPFAGETDVIVASFESDGGYLWARSFGSSLNDRGNTVAVNSAGVLAVGGQFFGTVSFDGQSVTAAQSSTGTSTQDGFVARLSP
jgi:hypothetical protein